MRRISDAAQTGLNTAYIDFLKKDHYHIHMGQPFYLQNRQTMSYKDLSLSKAG